jgi:hypothetical protein
VQILRAAGYFTVPGSVVFVPARSGHCIAAVTEDLSVLVITAGGGHP